MEINKFQWFLYNSMINSMMFHSCSMKKIPVKTITHRRNFAHDSPGFSHIFISYLPSNHHELLLITVMIFPWISRFTWWYLHENRNRPTTNSRGRSVPHSSTTSWSWCAASSPSWRAARWRHRGGSLRAGEVTKKKGDFIGDFHGIDWDLIWWFSGNQWNSMEFHAVLVWVWWVLVRI